MRAELAESEHFVGQVADDVMLVVRAVVRFLHVRLRSPKDYLRADGKGVKAVEESLQEDLFEWFESGALTEGLVIYEPRKVGGGRADIAIGFRDQQVVNELKRETKDSSRESMQRTYSEQAGSYDASDYPFGLVVVLDVATAPSSTPRLDKCVWVHKHEDDGGTRWLVFVRVPGRLSSPSAHTARAK